MNSSVLDIRETIVPVLCDEKFGKIKGVLVPFAAELVVVTKLSTVSEATAHMSKMLGRKISKRTVEDTLKKIREGTIKVSPEDIKRAASTHPLAERIFEYCPELTDPTKYGDELPDRSVGAQVSVPVAATLPTRKVQQLKTWTPSAPLAPKFDNSISADNPDAESIKAGEKAGAELIDAMRARSSP